MNMSSEKKQKWEAKPPCQVFCWQNFVLLLLLLLFFWVARVSDNKSENVCAAPGQRCVDGYQNAKDKTETSSQFKCFSLICFSMTFIYSWTNQLGDNRYFSASQTWIVDKCVLWISVDIFIKKTLIFVLHQITVNDMTLKSSLALKQQGQRNLSDMLM